MDLTTLGLKKPLITESYDLKIVNDNADKVNELITADREQINNLVDYVVPACRVYNSTEQSLADGVFTALSFDSERFDTDSIHDITTNNKRLKCKTAGKYLITGNVKFGVNTSGSRHLYLRLNGSTYLGAIIAPVGNFEPMYHVSTISDLNVDDYVELVARQTSGSSILTKIDSQTSTEFMIVKVG